MSDEPTFTVGDLERPLAGRLTDSGLPVDLAVAERIDVHIARPSGTVIDRQGEVTDSTTGRWRLPWIVGDLAEPGSHVAEVQVTWPGGRTQTFPPASFYVRAQIA